MAQNEGKGEFVAYLAQKLHKKGNLKAVVRTGGPNAGHTMTLTDPQDTSIKTVHKMRQIPCAWHLTDPPVPMFIAHGSLIDPAVLQSELEMIAEHYGMDNPDLPSIWVDKHAVVITSNHKEQEAYLRGQIGSTAEGIGAARAAHVMRRPVLAGGMKDQFPPKTYKRLYTDFNVAIELNSIIDSGGDILIESTQGFDLSINLSGHYPHTTSRDITPGQILSDCGISSRAEHRVIAVIRTHPIRVAGNSGPMRYETNWERLKIDSDGYIATPETTTVTGNTRRIGYYDSTQIIRMGKACRPDWIALTFLDYLDPRCAGMQGDKLDKHLQLSRDEGDVKGDKLVQGLVNFIEQVEKDSDSRIGWISTGPGVITSFGSPGPGGSADWGFAPDIGNHYTLSPNPAPESAPFPFGPGDADDAGNRYLKG